ncbi:putative pentatricopeptide repeat-containing protein At1g69350, mitochondrial [Selaginella moellendorffii]|uniref:putative pentatricopeptide repeat-containing protein At1g69350, mitochondrial n=1 Tax=Selaginella moellendorffii TaxID=88036 RepID=UPI000D1C4E18|nr:putative pentatricopeptide repeat-containing protein At1g69350, mitochondrial [Selaginella moellendorffii]|eukprot:XP_024539905.1 putative pentatricopeptide repeat-containing protein At1g69350, mitochondrial [Selaginella moellendorffii]
MYAKCGRLGDARRVFESMSSHDLVSWNCMIQGYAQRGEMDLALELYDRMQRQGCDPNRGTLLAALKASVSLAEREEEVEEESSKVSRRTKRGQCLERGREIHSHAVKTGNELDPFVANTLVAMYAKCGSMEEAREIFDKMRQRDVVSWNCLVMGYAKNEQGEMALELFSRMEEQGCQANAVTFLGALKACVSLAEKEQGTLVQGRVIKCECLERGRRIHSRAAETLGPDLFVANALIDFYSRCGSLDEARSVFEILDRRRDVVSWNSIIQGCTQSGEGDLALSFYRAMKGDGFQPNRVTVLAALKACVSSAEKEEDGDPESRVPSAKLARIQKRLEQGREIHFEAAKLGLDSDVFVASALVDMYAKFGSLPEARKIFESMKKRSVVPWTAIIMAYAQNGDGEMALRLYSRMQDEGCAPNRVTVLAAVKACVTLSEKEPAMKELSLGKGRAIHRQAVEMGVDSELFVANALIDMYSRCGSMADASQVFHGMKARDIVSWNSIIQGFAQREGGDPETALKLYARMLDEGKCSPNQVTTLAALRACVILSGREDARKLADVGVKVKSLERARGIHGGVLGKPETLVANSLIDVYSKCGSMSDARQVFDGMEEKQRSTVSWTAIIMGYAENGDGEEALELFERMMKEGSFAPSEVTLLGALKACSSLAEKEEAIYVQGKAVKARSLERGRYLHSQAIKLWNRDEELNVFLANALIDMYAKCGEMVEAQQVFDELDHRKSVVSWNSMIQGYAYAGNGAKALELFDQMDVFQRDGVTYLAALKACASIGRKSLGKGRVIHEEFIGMDNINDNRIDVLLANSLIDMYAKCGSLDESWMVFERIHPKQRTISSWNSIILAHAESGEEEQAMELYSQMKDLENFQPDAVTYFVVLKACGNLAALETGKKICNEIREVPGKLQDQVMLANSIVRFFAKCGCMDEAERVFHSISRKNIGSWSALIAGYSFHGDTDRVFELLETMIQEKNPRLLPNEMIFLSVLNACSHAGLVEKGLELFDVMRYTYGIPAGIHHYACMVDLLARANKLDEALAMVEGMPVEADAVVWTSLLAGATKWKNARIGCIAFEKGLELGSGKDRVANLILMSNLYASLGMFEEVIKIQDMKEQLHNS